MVVFKIDGLEVFFPYDFVYPEQYEYMKGLKDSLDARGHCVLEMPTGTGKTVSLFSLITSYQFANHDIGKLVYCTRTVPEMEKALEELKIVVEFRSRILEERETSGCSSGKRLGSALAIGLSARRNMCINPIVSQEPDREIVDQKCRMLTSRWTTQIREGMGIVEHASGTDVRMNETPQHRTAEDATAGSRGCGCEFYENLQLNEGTRIVPDDVYTIQDLKRLGATADRPFCPYFASRRLVHTADVVVLNYQYVLDPRVSAASLMMGGSGLGVETGGETGETPAVVVFDEAHNIDNVCVEALSVTLTRDTMEKASRALKKLEEAVNKEKQAGENLLADEYRRLVEGLRATGGIDDETISDLLSSPQLPEDAERTRIERVPGTIRKSEHFLSTLRRIITFLKGYMRVFETRSEGPLAFLLRAEEDAQVDSRTLRQIHERYKSLMSTLKLMPHGDLQHLSLVCDFVTLLATYCEGFIVIADPYPEAQGLWDPVLQLNCLDSSLAMKPVFKRFKSVVLTSATLSPLALYPKLLGFTPAVVKSLEMSLDRDCILPLVVSRGADQSAVSSRFDQRSDGSVVRNYGALLLGLAQSVPDGLVVFFTSYAYMDAVVSKWYSMGILAELHKYKLLFIESKDVVATTLALNNYRRACDCGRGAVFFSVARGKVSEGIDFDRHYGRAVLLLGVPFQYVLSKPLKARLDFLHLKHDIEEQAFLSFDAMRQASQCLGRVIRSKADYGLMVLADQRYGRADKLDKLPTWVRSRMGPAQLNLTSDRAVLQARTFLRNMSQPYKIGRATRLDKALLDEMERRLQIQKLGPQAAALLAEEEKKKEETKHHLSSSIKNLAQAAAASVLVPDVKSAKFDTLPQLLVKPEPGGLLPAPPQFASTPAPPPQSAGIFDESKQFAGAFAGVFAGGGAEQGDINMEGEENEIGERNKNNIDANQKAKSLYQVKPERFD